MKKNTTRLLILTIAIPTVGAALYYLLSVPIGWIALGIIVAYCSEAIYLERGKATKEMPQEVPCPNCYAPIKPSYKFCPNCQYHLSEKPEIVQFPQDSHLLTAKVVTHVSAPPVENPRNLPIVPQDSLPHEFIAFLNDVHSVITKLQNKDQFFGQAEALLESKKVSFEHYMKRVKELEEEIKSLIRDSKMTLEILGEWKKALMEAFNNADVWVQDYELRLASAGDYYLEAMRQEQMKWKADKDIYTALIDKINLMEAKAQLLMASLEVSFRKAFLRTLEEGKPLTETRTVQTQIKS